MRSTELVEGRNKGLRSIHPYKTSHDKCHMWISEKLYDSPVMSALSSSAPNVHYLQNTHPHCLLVSCSKSIQIHTSLLMCAVWLLNSWPWHSYLHLICSPSVREHYLIIFHAAFVFAHHHHLKAPHENRELIAPRWPSCHIYLRPSLWQLQLSLTKLIVCVVSSQTYAGSQSLV
jgi:hypothetical protein